MPRTRDAGSVNQCTAWSDGFNAVLLSSMLLGDKLPLANCRLKGRFLFGGPIISQLSQPLRTAVVLLFGLRALRQK